MTRTEGFKAVRVAIFLSCLLALISAPASAGVLDGNLNALTFSAYSGSQSFSNPPLAGALDYAVFTAMEFGTAFPGSTYVPTDAVVYSYQLDNTGTAAISAEIVGVTNPANGIDFFQYLVGEQAPSSAGFVSGNARWDFAGDNSLDQGEMSNILVFSSPNIPMAGASLTINGGTSAVLTDVPTPSATPIPEPATLSLLTVACGCMLMFVRRR